MWERLRSARDWLVAASTLGGSSVIGAVFAFVVTFFTTAPVWIVVLGTIGVMLIACVVIVIFVGRLLRPPASLAIAASGERTPEIPPHQTLDQTQTYYRGLHVQMVDLARASPLLSGKVFEDCSFFGPAVLVLSGTVGLEGTTIQADRPADVLFELESSRMTVFGPIVAHNCTFRRCHLFGIGLMSNPESIRRLREGFTQQITAKSPAVPQSPEPSKHD